MVELNKQKLDDRESGYCWEVKDDKMKEVIGSHSLCTVVKCVFSGTTFKSNFIFSFLRGGLQVGITTVGSDPTCSLLYCFLSMDS